MSRELIQKLENCKNNISILKTVDLIILKDTVDDELLTRGY